MTTVTEVDTGEAATGTAATRPGRMTPVTGAAWLILIKRWPAGLIRTDLPAADITATWAHTAREPLTTVRVKAPRTTPRRDPEAAHALAACLRPASLSLPTPGRRTGLSRPANRSHRAGPSLRAELSLRADLSFPTLARRADLSLPTLARRADLSRPTLARPTNRLLLADLPPPRTHLAQGPTQRRGPMRHPDPSPLLSPSLLREVPLNRDPSPLRARVSPRPLRAFRRPIRAFRLRIFQAEAFPEDIVDHRAGKAAAGTATAATGGDSIRLLLKLAAQRL